VFERTQKTFEQTRDPALRLDQQRLARGDVGHAGNAGDDAVEPGRRFAWTVGAGDAQAQNLGQALVELACLFERRSGLASQISCARELGERRYGVSVENLWIACAVHKLQRLRNELELDKPAARPFEVPGPAGSMLLEHQAAHVANIAERALWIAPGGERR